MENGVIFGLVMWAILIVGTLWVFVRWYRRPRTIVYCAPGTYTTPNPMLHIERREFLPQPAVAYVPEDTAVYPSEAPTDPKWPTRGDSL